MASPIDKIIAANSGNQLAQKWSAAQWQPNGWNTNPVWALGTAWQWPTASDIVFGGRNDPLAHPPTVPVMSFPGMGSPATGMMGGGTPSTPGMGSAMTGMMGGGMQGAMSGLAGMMAGQMQRPPTQVGTAWNQFGIPNPNAPPAATTPPPPKPEPGTDRNYVDPRTKQPLTTRGGGAAADDVTHGTALIAQTLAKNPTGNPPQAPTSTPKPTPKPGSGGGSRPWWRR